MYIKRILLIISILVACGLGFFSYYIYQTLFAGNTDFGQKTTSVYIESDSDYQDVLEKMEPLVKDLDAFDLVAQKKGYPQSLIPGRFILKKGMNNNEMVDVLRSQNTPVSVTFNNQERLQNLAGRISEQIEADSVSLVKAMTDSMFLKKHGFDQANALAMYIPNSYEFYWNTSAEEFRERMFEEYQRFWTPERLEKAKKINLSPKEVTALAAIVQKETAKVSERRRVAGVYMNRLENGWPLQADPTVIFAIKKKRQNFDTVIKRVLDKDLKVQSPYNTYLNPGLPPGPIYMPDISSIDAVLNHEEHDYFYFAADVDRWGYHKFALTLRQHNINAREYQRYLDKHDVRR
jgi:UPF0755 protein